MQSDFSSLQGVDQAYIKMLAENEECLQLTEEQKETIFTIDNKKTEYVKQLLSQGYSTSEIDIIQGSKFFRVDQRINNIMIILNQSAQSINLTKQQKKRQIHISTEYSQLLGRTVFAMPYTGNCLREYAYVLHMIGYGQLDSFITMTNKGQFEMIEDYSKACAIILSHTSVVHNQQMQECLDMELLKKRINFYKNSVTLIAHEHIFFTIGVDYQYDSDNQFIRLLDDRMDTYYGDLASKEFEKLKGTVKSDTDKISELYEGVDEDGFKLIVAKSRKQRYYEAIKEKIVTPVVKYVKQFNAKTGWTDWIDQPGGDRIRQYVKQGVPVAQQKMSYPQGKDKNPTILSSSLIDKKQKIETPQIKLDVGQTGQKLSQDIDKVKSAIDQVKSISVKDASLVQFARCKIGQNKQAIKEYVQKVVHVDEEQINTQNIESTSILQFAVYKTKNGINKLTDLIKGKKSEQNQLKEKSSKTLLEHIEQQEKTIKSLTDLNESLIRNNDYLLKQLEQLTQNKKQVDDKVSANHVESADMNGQLIVKKQSQTVIPNSIKISTPTVIDGFFEQWIQNNQKIDVNVQSNLTGSANINTQLKQVDVKDQAKLVGTTDINTQQIVQTATFNLAKIATPIVIDLEESKSVITAESESGAIAKKILGIDLKLFNMQNDLIYNELDNKLKTKFTMADLQSTMETVFEKQKQQKQQQAVLSGKKDTYVKKVNTTRLVLMRMSKKIKKDQNNKNYFNKQEINLIRNKGQSILQIIKNEEVSNKNIIVGLNAIAEKIQMNLNDGVIKDTCVYLLQLQQYREQNVSSDIRTKISQQKRITGKDTDHEMIYRDMMDLKKGLSQYTLEEIEKYSNIMSLEVLYSNQLALKSSDRVFTNFMRRQSAESFSKIKDSNEGLQKLKPILERYLNLLHEDQEIKHNKTFVAIPITEELLKQFRIKAHKQAVDDHYSSQYKTQVQKQQQSNIQISNKEILRQQKGGKHKQKDRENMIQKFVQEQQKQDFMQQPLQGYKYYRNFEEYKKAKKSSLTSYKCYTDETFYTKLIGEPNKYKQVLISIDDTQHMFITVPNKNKNCMIMASILIQCLECPSFLYKYGDQLKYMLNEDRPNFKGDKDFDVQEQYMVTLFKNVNQLENFDQFPVLDQVNSLRNIGINVVSVLNGSNQPSLISVFKDSQSLIGHTVVYMGTYNFKNQHPYRQFINNFDKFIEISKIESDDIQNLSHICGQIGTLFEIKFDLEEYLVQNTMLSQFFNDDFYNFNKIHIDAVINCSFTYSFNINIKQTQKQGDLIQAEIYQNNKQNKEYLNIYRTSDNDFTCTSTLVEKASLDLIQHDKTKEVRSDKTEKEVKSDKTESKKRNAGKKPHNYRSLDDEQKLQIDDIIERNNENADKLQDQQNKRLQARYSKNVVNMTSGFKRQSPFSYLWLNNDKVEYIHDHRLFVPEFYRQQCQQDHPYLIDHTSFNTCKNGHEGLRQVIDELSGEGKAILMTVILQREQMKENNDQAYIPEYIYQDIGSKIYKENELLKHSNTPFKIKCIKPVCSKYDEYELDKALLKYQEGSLAHIKEIIKVPLLLENVDKHLMDTIATDTVYYKEQLECYEYIAKQGYCVMVIKNEYDSNIDGVEYLEGGEGYFEITKDTDGDKQVDFRPTGAYKSYKHKIDIIPYAQDTWTHNGCQYTAIKRRRTGPFSAAVLYRLSKAPQLDVKEVIEQPLNQLKDVEELKNFDQNRLIWDAISVKPRLQYNYQTIDGHVKRLFSEWIKQSGNRELIQTNFILGFDKLLIHINQVLKQEIYANQKEEYGVVIYTDRDIYTATTDIKYYVLDQLNHAQNKQLEIGIFQEKQISESLYRYIHQLLYPYMQLIVEEYQQKYSIKGNDDCVIGISRLESIKKIYVQYQIILFTGFIYIFCEIVWALIYLFVSLPKNYNTGFLYGSFIFHISTMLDLFTIYIRCYLIYRGLKWYITNHLYKSLKELIEGQQIIIEQAESDQQVQQEQLNGQLEIIDQKELIQMKSDRLHQINQAIQFNMKKLQSRQLSIKGCEQMFKSEIDSKRESDPKLVNTVVLTTNQINDMQFKPVTAQQEQKIHMLYRNEHLKLQDYLQQMYKRNAYIVPTITSQSLLAFQNRKWESNTMLSSPMSIYHAFVQRSINPKVLPDQNYQAKISSFRKFDYILLRECIHEHVIISFEDYLYKHVEEKRKINKYRKAFEYFQDKGRISTYSNYILKIMEKLPSKKEELYRDVKNIISKCRGVVSPTFTYKAVVGWVLVNLIPILKNYYRKLLAGIHHISEYDLPSPFIQGEDANHITEAIDQIRSKFPKMYHVTTDKSQMDTHVTCSSAKYFINPIYINSVPLLTQKMGFASREQNEILRVILKRINVVGIKLTGKATGSKDRDTIKMLIQDFVRSGVTAETMIGHSVGEIEEALALANYYGYLSGFYPVIGSDDSINQIQEQFIPNLEQAYQEAYLDDKHDITYYGLGKVLKEKQINQHTGKFFSKLIITTSRKSFILREPQRFLFTGAWSEKINVTVQPGIYNYVVTKQLESWGKDISQVRQLIKERYDKLLHTYNHKKIKTFMKKESSKYTIVMSELESKTFDVHNQDFREYVGRFMPKIMTIYDSMATLDGLIDTCKLRINQNSTFS